MGEYSRLGKNTILVFIGDAGAKVISLIMLPFYTSWLSVEEYGTTDLLQVYVTFLLGIVSCCIAESIFIFPKGQDHNTQKEYLSSGLAFVLLMIAVATIVFYLIGELAPMLDINNSFVKYRWMIMGLMAAQILQQLFQQFTRSIDCMRVYGISGIILTGLTAVFAFLFIPNYGVTGFVLSIILANLCTVVYSIVFTKGWNYISFRSIRKDRCKEMLHYSIPLIPNGVMWWLVGALNRPLMKSHLGLTAVGLFAVANKFPGILTMLFGVFVRSWQISVLEEYGKNGFEQFYNKIFRYVVFALVIIFVSITLCSELLVRMFTTANFYPAWQYIPILTFGALLSNVSGLAGTSYAAVKKSKHFFYSSVWGAITAIVFNFLLIPAFGIVGACSSVVLSFGAMAISRIWYSWKIVRLQDIRYYLVLLAFCVIVILLSGISDMLIRTAAIVAMLLLALFMGRKMIMGIVKKLTNKIKIR